MHVSKISPVIRGETKYIYSHGAEFRQLYLTVAIYICPYIYDRDGCTGRALIGAHADRSQRPGASGDNDPLRLRLKYTPNSKGSAPLHSSCAGHIQMSSGPLPNPRRQLCVRNRIIVLQYTPYHRRGMKADKPSLGRSIPKYTCLPKYHSD